MLAFTPVSEQQHMHAIDMYAIAATMACIAALKTEKYLQQSGTTVLQWDAVYPPTNPMGSKYSCGGAHQQPCGWNYTDGAEHPGRGGMKSFLPPLASPYGSPCGEVD